MSAIDTTTILLTAHERMAEERGGVAMGVFGLYDVIVEPASRPSHRRQIGALEGIGAIPAHDGVKDYPTIGLSRARGIYIDYVEYAQRLRVPWLRSEELPRIWEWAGPTLLREAWQTAATAAELFIPTCFSTAMYSGGQPLFSAAHPTTQGTRSNKITDPLDVDGLWANRVNMRGWVTSEGTQDGQLGQSMTLTCGPGNERNAYEAVGHQLAGSTGNAQQGTTGALHGISTAILVLNSWSDDDEDWLLSQPPQARAMDDPDSPNPNPLRFWWRKMPYVYPVDRDRATGQLEIVVGMAFGLASGPLPGHHFASEVA